MIELGLVALVMGFVLNREQAENDKIVEREMEKYCQKMAEKYGVQRGIKFEDLRSQIVGNDVLYRELYMKNEDAVRFLEAECQDMEQRREKMYRELAKVPVGVQISGDLSQVWIGRGIDGSGQKGSMEDKLTNFDKYVENGQTGQTAEEYLQRVFYSINTIIDEVGTDIAILQKGISGEEYVNEQLRLYEGKYKVLQNIVIPSEDSQGNTSEVDVYVITDKGLVVAEVKNYGNEKQKLHITSDGRWVIEDMYGNILRTIDKSPIEQNTRHCLAAERLLKKEFGEDCNIPIIPIIFIANNKVSIQNESRSAVYRVSEFYTFMQSINNGANVSKGEQDRIERLLKNMDMGAQEFRLTSRALAMDRLEMMERAVTNYLFYNCEVAQEHERLTKKYDAGITKKNMKKLLPLAIPYLIFFIIGFEPKFRIVLLVGYTLMLFNIPIGLIAGVIIFFLIM